MKMIKYIGILLIILFANIAWGQNAKQTVKKETQKTTKTTVQKETKNATKTAVQKKVKKVPTANAKKKMLSKLKSNMQKKKLRTATKRAKIVRKGKL